MEVNNKPTESVEANDELKQTAEDLSQPVAEVPVTVEESSNSVDTEKAFDGTESKLSGDIQATSATKATNPIKEVVGEVTDEFENMTIFGNKSLAELHKIQAGQSHLSAGILFTDPSLKIPKPIVESLTLEMRFEKPSAIQASTLPVILDGNNVIAQAQSGAGKTVAFVTGMLASIDTSKNVVQALCLTPVRELVFQIIRDTIRPLSSRIPELRAEEALPDREVAKGSICTSHIIVGTPGTVKRWLNNGYLRPSSIKIFVLDEADKMVEEQSLGKDTLMIKQKLNPSCQILFFSATYSKAILDYARKIVPRAYIFTPRSNEELVLDVIFQIKMNVSAFPGGKLQALQDIYDMMTLGGQSIVFVEMKKSADSVTNMMRSAGFEVSSLHGDLLPAERDSVMEEFRKGRSKVLITTNALARGVDVPAVAMVVNFDLPVKRMGQKIAPDTETYLHRIGRCGRFGRRGTAINFIEKPDDFKILDDIEKHYSPTKKMLTEWDPSDIHGLKSAISDRPEGGEVLPEAMNDSKSAATASVDVAVFE